VLRQKYKAAIQAKLSLGYGKDALCQRTVDTLAARFTSGRISAEDDDRPGRPSSDSLSVAVSGYLNINPYTSCRDIAKELFIPTTIVLRFLDETGLCFFVVRWMSHELRTGLKAKRVEIYREILEVLEQLGSRQKHHGITWDECWIYWKNYHRGQWKADRVAVSSEIRTTMSSERTMISAYFTR
jgi:hypothetical protein